jgi:hypothetical protein
MFRTLPYALLATAFAAATLAAQAPNSNSGTSNRVTATGCIERADQMTTASSSLGGAVDSLEFVLIRPAAEPGSSAANAAPSPTGTTGDSRVMYRLTGDQQKLNPHVGHKVEIVGTAALTSPAGSGASPAPGASALPPGSAPGLSVESVRMIDATCSATK